MGSKRKQKEKQKDFKKAKLKVGKTAQKADNYTDTSFKSKTISLPGQSITHAHSSKDLQHQLSLTKHHSSTARKEVVISLTQNLPSNPSSYKQIITSVTPLMLDESKQVRLEVLKLLQECGKKQPGLLDLHKRTIILFTISAMTHISPDIRNTSTKFLDVVIEYADVKSYFVKILKNIFILMGWSLQNDSKSKSVSITSSSSILLGTNTKKARIDHLSVLANFLQSTLFEQNEKAVSENSPDAIATHTQSYKYLIPTIPQAYAPLKLFVNEMNVGDGNFEDLQNLDTLTTEDLSTRVNAMNSFFKEKLMHNLSSLVKEGGEVGRESTRSTALLRQPQFHTSATLLASSKKNSKSKRAQKQQKIQIQDDKIQAEAEEEVVTPTIDFKDATARFESIISRFDKLANEIKLGKLNPKIFDNLLVNVGNQKEVVEVPFNTIAQTSVKGRNFIITMFDPSNAQAIINTIIGSGLNMSGIVDPANKFNIKVPLPPITLETKQNDVKLLKELFDKLRNNKTGSLTSVRGDVRHKFQSHLKTHKLSDLENKQLTQLEKLHKLYVDKLQESFKQYEKRILQ
ncbi:IPI1 [Candida theae]|uniref:Ribosome-recycling factor, mitochondrial n=1 Tax=Candida theae TaxID=1198502 RepID=A0AAD5B9N7_9ASCO|nr:IPI1 [Candida theae]KAI5948903.1 IPI1 [Candida theae]